MPGHSFRPGRSAQCSCKHSHKESTREFYEWHREIRLGSSVSLVYLPKSLISGHYLWPSKTLTVWSAQRIAGCSTRRLLPYRLSGERRKALTARDATAKSKTMKSPKNGVGGRTVCLSSMRR